MERFDNLSNYHSWYEHWHRYHFVLSLVNNLKVADIACGEGYGSALLATKAFQVTGVDIDNDTVKNARVNYSKHKNLNYICSDATHLSLPDNEYDVVISFETLEHLKEQEQLLKEFKRILKTNGLLIISTPDKEVYSKLDENHNQYHVKELNAIEFNDLIKSYFSNHVTYGQKLQLGSLIESMDSSFQQKPTSSLFVEPGNEKIPQKNNTPSQYLIKFCSDSLKTIEKLNLSSSNFFSDTNNRLYNHYEEQIIRLLQIDKENLQLKKLLKEKNSIINHLKARLGY